MSPSIAAGPPSTADAALLAANFAAALPKAHSASFAAWLQSQPAPEPPTASVKAEATSDIDVDDEEDEIDSPANFAHKLASLIALTSPPGSIPQLSPE